MSNEYEFKVHNFYNYTLEELPKLKEEFKASVSEFEGMYEQTVIFKQAEADLKKLNKNDWYKKYVNNGDYWVEDDYIYTLAEEHYKENE